MKRIAYLRTRLFLTAAGVAIATCIAGAATTSLPSVQSFLAQLLKWEIVTVGGLAVVVFIVHVWSSEFEW